MKVWRVVFPSLSLIDSFILLVSSGMPCRYGAGIGKFQRSKVHGKCVQMHVRPFMKLGCNPCLTKELQPNRLHINHLRFTLPLLPAPLQALQSAHGMENS